MVYLTIIFFLHDYQHERNESTTGRSLHYQVEHHVQQKQIYFDKLHHQIGSKLSKKNSWVDIHDVYYILKNGNQSWGFYFNKTYRF